MTLTLEKIKAALKHDGERCEAERAQREQRLKDGLPSWDLIVSGKQWPLYRDEGIKAGCVIEAENHYVVSTPPYPPARVMLSWGVGEDMTIPNPKTNDSNDGKPE